MTEGPSTAAGFETVFFLSDYGLTDEFVGVVKAVIRSIAPAARVIDVTHRVPPHDVRAGSLTLARSMQYLGSGVVLAVVDPGVGSARRAVAVEVGGGPGGGEDEGAPVAVLIGPDNGLLAPAVAMAGGARRAVELTDERYRLDAPGPTFAGRDVFAPAAAFVCAGLDLGELGPAVDPLSLLPGIVPLPDVSEGKVLGEVLWVDRFGNVQLNVDPDDLPVRPNTGPRRVGEAADPLVVHAHGKTRTAVRVRTYDDLRTGQVGVLVDSYGLVALVCQRRSAAQELGLGAGDPVTLEAYAG